MSVKDDRATRFSCSDHLTLQVEWQEGHPAQKLNSTQLNLLMYGSCEAGLNNHREHIIKHKA